MNQDIITNGNLSYRMVTPVGYLLSQGKRYLILGWWDVERPAQWFTGLDYFNVTVTFDGECKEYITTKDEKNRTITKPAYRSFVVGVSAGNYTIEYAYFGKPIPVLIEAEWDDRDDVIVNAQLDEYGEPLLPFVPVEDPIETDDAWLTIYEDDAGYAGQDDDDDN